MLSYRLLYLPQYQLLYLPQYQLLYLPQYQLRFLLSYLSVLSQEFRKSLYRRLCRES